MRRATARHGVGAATALLALVWVAPLSAQSWRTLSASRDVRAEDALDVRVTYGVGDFTLRSAPGDVLYRARIRYDEDAFEPRTDFDGRILRVGLRKIGGASGFGRGLGRDRGGEMELELTRVVPTDLAIEFGAGRADLDLGGLPLRRLTLETGASETVLDVSRPNPETVDEVLFQVGAADFTALHLGNLGARTIELHAGVGDVTIDLTGAWRHDATVRVEMGLGSLELVLPHGIGVKLERETLLTTLDAPDLIRRGDAFYSADWDDAARRITLEVHAAFGKVELRRAP